MKIVKEEKLINENERGDCQEFVMHGSNISGAVKVLKQNKSIEKMKYFTLCVYNLERELPSF